jgi:subtilisin family serine protease
MVSEKLDGFLAARVHQLREIPPEDASTAAAELVPVLVQVPGDVAAAEAAGLRTETVIGDVVLGEIAVGDLERLTAVDDVLSIQLERNVRPDLHTSVPEIHADHVHTGILQLTGRNVIVGVVDTGIDIYHHAFRRENGTTRLLNLLDLSIRNAITITGNPTGGNFTLSWEPPAPAGGGPTPPPQTTANIPFNATAQQVLAALSALPAIKAGDLVVSGGPLPGNPVVVDFAGQYNRDKIAPLRAPSTALTGGASPKVEVERRREYTEAGINAALSTPGMPFDSVDREGHGTHVMGIAAGDGSQKPECHGTGYYVGVAPDADLIMVKTGFRSGDTLRGAKYIFERATALGRTAVVNISLGGELGAHDGTDAEEVALDALLTGTTGRVIVVSAGNDGNLFDHDHPENGPWRGGGLHSRKTVNGSATMQFVIAPGDRSDDFFDLWYEGPGRLNLQLTAPGGAQLAAPLAPNDPPVTSPLAAHPLYIWSHLSASQNGRHEIYIKLSPATTAGIVAPGTWRITLTETTGTPTDVDCWISLDKVDPHPRFINADQDRTRTVTLPGTANNVITVGSYNPATSVLADSSSRGPTLNTPARRKPEICAPGEGIIAALTGVSKDRPCSDCCATFYIDKSGTSMAAPHVTGIVALLFQRNRALNFTQVRAQLEATCRPPDPITGPTLPNNEWGHGKVDAELACAGVPAHALADQDGPQMRSVVLPVSAYPDVYLPARMRLRELERALAASTTGQLVAYLISLHMDETLRLINTNRRVAVAWHQAKGPLLVRVLLRGGHEEGELPRMLRGTLMPTVIDGVAVGDALERFLDELERCASPALQADVRQHRTFILSLPGASLTELDRTLAA